MKALSSQIGHAKTAYIAGIGALAIAAILLLSIPIMASAAGTTVDVNATSVYGQSITVSGMVIPNPGANQEVSVAVTAPDGANVLTSVVPVDSSTGVYTYTAVPGGSSHWVNGTYTVSATWGTISQAFTNTTTFGYGTFTTTTTTTPTSSSSTGSGTTTTIFSNTTISSITTLTSVTTVISGTTLTSVTTLVSSFNTTVTSGSSNSTALIVGIVGIIIAVIAGAIAAMALRKH